MPIELGANALTSSSVAPKLNKPVYLITLADGTGKTAAITYFIATDKPELTMGFVSVRGIFTEEEEDAIIRSFSEIVGKTPKETVVEMMFPVHRIRSIRSLVFNAVKTVQRLPTGKE
jgi:hypothetical protein